LTVCPNCGREVMGYLNFCPNCGHPLRSLDRAYPYRSTSKVRDPRITFLIGMIPGLIGIYGLGHFYIGKTIRGLVLFLMGVLVFNRIFLGLLLYLLVAGWGGESDLYGYLPWLILGALVGIAQAFDSFFLSRKYNAIVTKGGMTPW